MTSPHTHAPAMSRRAPDRVWPARVAALATGIALAAMYMASGMGGDDWAYMTVFGRADATVATGSTLVHKLAAFPASHWLHTNGRAANYLAAYMLGLLPTWVVHAMLATAALALSLLTTRLCGAWHDPHRQCTGALASAAVMFALPWGDEMFTVDVALNYMVASALTAGFVWATLSRRIGRPWLCVWGLVAGMMHEAAGVPLALAALTMAATHHGIWPGRTQSSSHDHSQNHSHGQKAAWLCFAAGALAAVASPGIWARAAETAGATRHWHMWESLLYSAPLTVLLAATLIFMALRGGLPRLRHALSGTTGLFAVAALFAVPFVMVGDYVGRVGWFAQFYALIALLRLVPPSTAHNPARRLLTGATACLTAVALTAAHTILTLPLLADDGRLAADIDRQALAAPAGGNAIIYVDFPQVDRQPWYTWGKLRSIESHSQWQFQQIARYYRLGEVTLLPRQAADIDLDSLAGAVTLATGETISPKPLQPRQGAPYRRRTIFTAPVPTADCPTEVFTFHTPSQRRLWLAAPRRYHFYHWPSAQQ